MKAKTVISYCLNFLLSPYTIGLGGVGFIGFVLLADLSKQTLILLHAGVSGIGLGIVFIALFAAMYIDAGHVN